jgi:hypothetical protein
MDSNLFCLFFLWNILYLRNVECGTEIDVMQTENDKTNLLNGSFLYNYEIRGSTILKWHHAHQWVQCTDESLMKFSFWHTCTSFQFVWTINSCEPMKVLEIPSNHLSSTICKNVWHSLFIFLTVLYNIFYLTLFNTFLISHHFNSESLKYSQLSPT